MTNQCIVELHDTKKRNALWILFGPYWWGRLGSFPACLYKMRYCERIFRATDKEKGNSICKCKLSSKGGSDEVAGTNRSVLEVTKRWFVHDTQLQENSMN